MTLLLLYAVSLFRRGSARIAENRGEVTYWAIFGSLVLLAAFVMFRGLFASGFHFVVNSFFQALHDSHATDHNHDLHNVPVPHVGNPADKATGPLYRPGSGK